MKLIGIASREIREHHLEKRLVHGRLGDIGAHEKKLVMEAH